MAIFPREELAKDALLPSAEHGFVGFPPAYNAQSEAEVDAIIRDLKAKGVKIIKELQRETSNHIAALLMAFQKKSILFPR